MSTESTLTSAATINENQTSVKNTWNIIFVAVDINEQYSQNIIPTDDPIELGIKHFMADVEAMPYSELLNVFVLDYRSNAPCGHAKHYDLEKPNISTNPSGNNKFRKQSTIPFNCHDDASYSKYLNSLGLEGETNKIMVIFLAHSFGAGFLSFTPLPLSGQTPEKIFNLDINKFSQALKDSFGVNTINCLLALNCTIQTVETNCLLRNKVDFIIGSQQILYPESIFYQRLLFDLVNYSYHTRMPEIQMVYNDEHLFTKFITNCHSEYLKSTLLSSSDYPFCVTLSKPYNSRYVMFYLELFGGFIKMFQNVIDAENIFQSKIYCKDPDNDDSVNFLDARLFFEKMKEYFQISSNNNKVQKIKAKILDYIISQIKHIVIYSLADGNCTIEDDGFSEDVNIHIPHGLGIFLAKRRKEDAILDETQEVAAILESKLFDGTFLLNDSDWLDVALGEVGPNWIKRWIEFYKDKDTNINVSPLRRWSANTNVFVDNLISLF